MKHTKSRILAIFLCLCMVVTLVPTVAFAAEGAVTLKVSSSASNDDAARAENAEYKTLNGALTKAQDGDTIILMGDVTDNTNAIAINKSVTIKSDDNSKRTLTVKTLNISGTGKTVTLENLKITRAALSVTNDSGVGVYAIVAVGFNNNSELDSTTPTLNIKDCEISISGSVAAQQGDQNNIQTAALRVGSGTVTVEDSTIKNNVTVTNAAAEAIQIDTASSGGENATRSLKITGSSVECTNGSGVLFTTTTKNATLAVNGGTVNAKYCINYTGAASNTVTVGQGVTLEGWSAVTVRGSGLTATITDATIKSENKQTDGANNYAVFAFESGNNNTVNVSGGSISADGGASNSLSQRVACFYEEGTGNSLEITGNATVKVENNADNRWFIYKKDPGSTSDYTPSNGNGTVKIGDDVTLQTGDGEDASFVVKDKDGNIVNVTEKFNSAVELVKDETSGVKEGSTIVVGEDATIDGGSVEVPAGLTVDVTKNKTVAQQVKPATGVIVVYGITDGDKTEDKSFDSINNAPSSDVLNVKEAGFKAKAADAKAAIDAALAEEEKGPVSDVSDNTVYIILDHRVAGTSFKVKVTKGSDEVYYESPAESSNARIFYFTFPTADNESYQGGSPAKKVIAPGEYTVKLYAGDQEISNATATLKIYEVKYVAGTGVTGTETTVYVDEAGLDAAKSATGSTMGFALSGNNNRWSNPVVEGSDYSFTVTYSGYYQSTGGGTVTPSTTVKTESAKNGSFTVSDKYASAGKTVKVTPKANEGYVVDQVTVTDKNGNNITVTQNADGTYSFVMPAKSAQPVDVKVTFKEEEQVHVCPSEKFTDVDQDKWYHEGVDYAIKNGLMEGVGSNLFAPDATTTRAMVVTILYRLDGEPAVMKDIPFADVPAGQWYSNAINWAAANGIVDGYGNGKFGPDDTITREQMAAILYRYASYKGYSVSDLANLTGYTDAASVSEWASTAMRWAVAEGLIEGTSATTLSPSGDSTRAQVATILMRFCEGVVK